MSQRPQIGFIVEGRGEWNAYQSIAAKICGYPIYCRSINTEGYGGITSNIEEHLRDLVSIAHPYHIIVALDMIDVIKAGLFHSCEELKKHLINRVEVWQQQASTHPKFTPLPDSITIVIQVPKFESWLIADFDGISSVGLIKAKDGDTSFEDVDRQVDDPASWLKDRIQNYRSKDPGVAKKLITASDVTIMQERSRSFRKLAKEILRCISSDVS